MPWLEPKELGKLQNEIKNLKEAVAKWKKWWNVEAEKIEKAQTVLNNPPHINLTNINDLDSYTDWLTKLRESLSP